MVASSSRNAVPGGGGGGGGGGGAILIIYRSTGVLNFAQGEMATFTTFIAWTLVDHGLGYWAAFPLTLLIAFVGGIALERTIIRPVEGKPLVTVVSLTIGLFIMLGGLTNWIWASEVRSFPPSRRPTPGTSAESLSPSRTSASSQLRSGSSAACTSSSS